jgi:cytochrome c biogenesis protein CcdA
MQMIRALTIAFMVVAGILAPGPADPVAASTDPPPVELTLFYGDGCPHCHAEIEFLVELQERWPELRIVAYEVWNDAANRALFQETAAAHGIDASGVPGTFVGGRAWIGFSPSIATDIEATVAALLSGTEPAEPAAATIDVPLVGDVVVGDRSLVVATLLIGFVDGVNPCSLWVLSVLLALVLHSGSRTRVFAVGSLFLVVTSALYGLYMLGAYSALDYAGEARWIRLAVAAVAGTFGVLHLKEYVTPAGPSLTISADRRPGLYRKMRGLAAADRSLPAVLGGTAALAVGVSLLETPCTAGLPLLWTDMVAQRNVPAAGAAFLFVLYLSVFLLDELVLFGAAVVTLRATKMQERHGRVLQLASGTLMLTLAGAMVFTPTALESLAGTLVVFAVAASVVGLALLVEWIRSTHRHPQRHPA